MAVRKITVVRRLKVYYLTEDELDALVGGFPWKQLALAAIAGLLMTRVFLWVLT